MKVSRLQVNLAHKYHYRHDILHRTDHNQSTFKLIYTSIVHESHMSYKEQEVAGSPSGEFLKRHESNIFNLGPHESKPFCLGPNIQKHVTELLSQQLIM